MCAFFKKFFLFELEQNNACQYDSVTVRDTNGTQLHKLCGENQENIEVVLPLISCILVLLFNKPLLTLGHFDRQPSNFGAEI